MIEVSDLYKSYHDGERDIIPLNNINFSCKKGEFIIITGRSGTGKTTFLNVMGGLTRPDRGVVRVAGNDLLNLNDTDGSRLRNDTFGFVFQFPGLLSALSTLENVTLPSVLAGKPPSEERGRELLHRVGLTDKADYSPSHLSGGELKRTSIARALINKPSIILADEPTADLDSETELEIMRIFADINSNGTTIIMVTHSAELASFATRVLIMANGHLFERQ